MIFLNGVVPENVKRMLNEGRGDELENILLNGGSGGSGGGSGGSGGSSGGVGYDNGGLTAEEVAAMQRYFGVTADGKWGPASQASAGGLNADEAWWAYENAMLEQGGSPQTGGDDSEVENMSGDSWVYVLGLGRITWQELEDYVDSGKIKESKTSDGKYKYTLAK